MIFVVQIRPFQKLRRSFLRLVLAVISQSRPFGAAASPVTAPISPSGARTIFHCPADCLYSASRPVTRAPEFFTSLKPASQACRPEPASACKEVGTVEGVQVEPFQCSTVLQRGVPWG